MEARILLLLLAWRNLEKKTHLDAGLVVVIDGAGHHVGGGLGLGGVVRVLGVLAHGGEGRARGPEHREVSRGLACRVEAGRGARGRRGRQQRAARRQEGRGHGARRGAQLRGPPQLVDVVLQLLQLLQVRGLQCCRVKQRGARGA